MAIALTIEDLIRECKFSENKNNETKNETVATQNTSDVLQKRKPNNTYIDENGVRRDDTFVSSNIDGRVPLDLV